MRQIYNSDGSYAFSIKKWLDKYFIGIKIFTAIVIILVCAYYVYKNNWLWAVFSLFTLSLFAIKNKYYKEFINALASLKRGILGEEIVAESLENSKLFGNDYWYIRNYTNKAACSGDIDGILLGPRGMFLLEVKNWYGKYRFFGMDVYKHVLSKFYPFKSPVKQLSINKERLIQYFLERGIEINPRPFVVFVNGYVEQINGKTGIFITNQKKIADKIFTSPNQNLSLVEIDSILKALGINKFL